LDESDRRVNFGGTPDEEENMAEKDKNLLEALKKAKGKRMAFAFALKGSEGRLLVAPKITSIQVTQLKKETGATTAIEGECFGEDGKMVFLVEREPPGTLETALRKTVTHDAGMMGPIEIRVPTAAEKDAHKVAPQAPPSPDTGKHALGPHEFGTLRLAWDTACKKVEGELVGLEKDILDEFRGDEDFNEIATAVRKLDDILQTLTSELSDKLDAAMNHEGPQRAALQQDAATLADKYLAYVLGNPLIEDLNDNPFRPVTVGKTLTTTLTLISTKLHG
jgi:hypothetical protein